MRRRLSNNNIGTLIGSLAYNLRTRHAPHLDASSSSRTGISESKLSDPLYAVTVQLTVLLVYVPALPPRAKVG